MYKIATFTHPASSSSSDLCVNWLDASETRPQQQCTLWQALKQANALSDTTLRVKITLDVDAFNAWRSSASVPAISARGGQSTTCPIDYDSDGYTLFKIAHPHTTIDFQGILGITTSDTARSLWCVAASDVTLKNMNGVYAGKSVIAWTPGVDRLWIENVFSAPSVDSRELYVPDDFDPAAWPALDASSNLSWRYDNYNTERFLTIKGDHVGLHIEHVTTGHMYLGRGIALVNGANVKDADISYFRLLGAHGSGTYCSTTDGRRCYANFLWKTNNTTVLTNWALSHVRIDPSDGNTQHTHLVSLANATITNFRMTDSVISRPQVSEAVFQFQGAQIDGMTFSGLTLDGMNYLATNSVFRFDSATVKNLAMTDTVISGANATISVFHFRGAKTDGLTFDHLTVENMASQATDIFSFDLAGTVVKDLRVVDTVISGARISDSVFQFQYAPVDGAKFTRVKILNTTGAVNSLIRLNGDDSRQVRNVTFDGCEFRGGSTITNAAIYMDSARFTDLTVKDSTFANLTTNWAVISLWNGIHLGTGSAKKPVRITGSTFENNSVKYSILGLAVDSLAAFQGQKLWAEVLDNHLLGNTTADGLTGYMGQLNIGAHDVDGTHTTLVQGNEFRAGEGGSSNWNIAIHFRGDNPSTGTFNGQSISANSHVEIVSNAFSGYSKSTIMLDQAGGVRVQWNTFGEGSGSAYKGLDEGTQAKWLYDRQEPNAVGVSITDGHPAGTSNATRLVQNGTFSNPVNRSIQPWIPTGATPEPDRGKCSAEFTFQKKPTGPSIASYTSGNVVNTTGTAAPYLHLPYTIDFYRSDAPGRAEARVGMIEVSQIKASWVDPGDHGKGLAADEAGPVDAIRLVHYIVNDEGEATEISREVVENDTSPQPIKLVLDEVGGRYVNAQVTSHVNGVYESSQFSPSILTPRQNCVIPEFTIQKSGWSADGHNLPSGSVVAAGFVSWDYDVVNNTQGVEEFAEATLLIRVKDDQKQDDESVVCADTLDSQRPWVASGAPKPVSLPKLSCTWFQELTYEVSP
ncbi:MAG: hypothetical protein LBR33_02325 [Propionibacteriaceae bacterium]|nr:hypothetical protein [Propionibacteriaceae bacterium]